MSQRKTRSKETALEGPAGPSLAPIELVAAFQRAVGASVRERDPSREAVSVELLVIAGIGSFEALARLNDLSRKGEREGDSPFDVKRSDVELANDRWLEMASALQGRLFNLEYRGYESESFSVFLDAMRRSSEIASEAKERDLLEHRALRVSDLAALAARLKPRQDVYENSEEEGGRSGTATSRSFRPCPTLAGGIRRIDPP